MDLSGMHVILYQYTNNLNETKQVILKYNIENLITFEV